MTRRGTTLTEVLMSIVLMGIGCVTLATLFPISILRTTQAVQKTNATIHRFNAESFIDVFNLVNAGDFPDPTPPDVTKGVIDPLGWYIIDTSYQASFGNDGAAPLPLLMRLDPSTYTGNVSDADKLFTSPDSMVEIVTGPVENSTATSTDLQSSVSMDGVSSGQQAILFSANGKSAEVRTIAAPVGQTISWSAPLTFTSIERVRIQRPERHYTCLMTVRKLPLADPTIDVVVFFRRTFSPEDERVYSWPGAATAFRAGESEVQIDYSPTPNKPPLTVGSFVFDAMNCRWYRISGVTDDGAGTATLRIDRPALENSDAAILMRGIIDVFPIGSKMPQ